MRLPEDTNRGCTQHAVLVEGEQTEHGTALMAAGWGRVSKDIFQGRTCCPKPARAELTLSEPQFGEGL